MIRNLYLFQVKLIPRKDPSHKRPEILGGQEIISLGYPMLNVCVFIELIMPGRSQ